MNIIKAISAFAVAAAVSVSAFAQKDMQKNAELVADISTLNAYETSLLELATTKAHSQELKDAASQMLGDHRTMGDQLNQYASSNGMAAIGKTDKVMDKMNNWNEKPASLEWDADVLEELIDLHKDEADVLQKAAKETKDADLKAWATSSIPVIKNHAKMLESLKSKIKKPWKDENRPSPDMKSGKK